MGYCPTCNKKYIRKGWLHKHIGKFLPKGLKMFNGQIMKQKQVEDFTDDSIL